MTIGCIDFVILRYVHVQVRCAMESFGNVHQPAITEFQKRKKTSCCDHADMKCKLENTSS
jgi:hypothetical protein